MSNPLYILDSLHEQDSLSAFDIKRITRLRAHQFKLSIAKLLKNGYILDLGPAPPDGKPGQRSANNLYSITPKGILHLEHQFTAGIPIAANPYVPDYSRIREILKAPRTMSNTKAVEQWNIETNYYLPYGDEPLKEIV
jgi:hypothetical protein